MRPVILRIQKLSHPVWTSITSGQLRWVVLVIWTEKSTHVKVILVDQWSVWKNHWRILVISIQFSEGWCLGEKDVHEQVNLVSMPVSQIMSNGFTIRFDQERHLLMTIAVIQQIVSILPQTHFLIVPIQNAKFIVKIRDTSPTWPKQFVRKKNSPIVEKAGFHGDNQHFTSVNLIVKDPKF